MTAKEYLSQIGVYKRIIAHKRKQHEAARGDIAYIRGLDYSRDRVQTNPGEGAAGVAIKLADFDRELCETITEYSRKIDEITDKIHALGNANYIDCLYQHYFDGLGFDEVSFNMGYNYSYILHLHSDALKAFAEANPDIANLT